MVYKSTSRYHFELDTPVVLARQQLTVLLRHDVYSAGFLTLTLIPSSKELTLQRPDVGHQTDADAPLLYFEKRRKCQIIFSFTHMKTDIGIIENTVIF